MTTPGARFLPPFAFGGDYNPEQWPAHVHAEDLSLMQEAGVDLVTLGVFSWALLEPVEGRYEFGWLDRIIEQLHAAGVRVDLATATASPPPWLAHRWPESLPMTAEGNRMWPGARQGFCPSSPVYRERALALCRAMAERYGKHPAVVLWHVGNELGNHNALCYCDVSAAAVPGLARATLRRDRRPERRRGEPRSGPSVRLVRRGAALHASLLPSRTRPSSWTSAGSAPTSSWTTTSASATSSGSCLPGCPITTNFMVMEHVREMDYWAWAREVDVVSNDHYLMREKPQAWRELAFSADLTRGLAGGSRWLLMEHSTSAVNWQPRNLPKRPAS
jgi:beta-galactosidase